MTRTTEKGLKNNHIKQYEKRLVDLLRGFKDRLNRNSNLRFEIEKNIERIIHD